MPFNRRILAILAALALAAFTATTAAAQWPTTCVQANDAFELYVGNHHNVGIYERTFGAGPQAEAACRTDHRDDMREVFAWLFTAVEPPAPAPQPEPTPAPAPVTTGVYWEGRLADVRDLIIRADPDGLGHQLSSPYIDGLQVIFTSTLPPNAHAAFKSQPLTIGVRIDLRGESLEALAATVAHELAHALDYVYGLQGQSYEECIERRDHGNSVCSAYLGAGGRRIKRSTHRLGAVPSLELGVGRGRHSRHSDSRELQRGPVS